eukprot:6195415-Pleurochrysis_carterae.AAC.2
MAKLRCVTYCGRRSTCNGLLLCSRRRVAEKYAQCKPSLGGVVTGGWPARTGQLPPMGEWACGEIRGY